MFCKFLCSIVVVDFDTFSTVYTLNKIQIKCKITVEKCYKIASKCIHISPWIIIFIFYKYKLKIKKKKPYTFANTYVIVLLFFLGNFVAKIYVKMYVCVCLFLLVDKCSKLTKWLIGAKISKKHHDRVR